MKTTLRHLTLTTAAALIAALALGACGKADPAETTGSDGPGDPTAPAVADHLTPDKRAIVDGYDALRDALARDSLGDTKTTAQTLLAALEEQELPAFARTARVMEGAQDLETARLIFGEISKAYITWLVEHPDAAEGLHVFRCPMAKGYEKWVEKQAKMANPYMGQRMLQCGGPTELAP